MCIIARLSLSHVFWPCDFFPCLSPLWTLVQILPRTPALHVDLVFIPAWLCVFVSYFRFSTRSKTQRLFVWLLVKQDKSKYQNKQKNIMNYNYCTYINVNPFCWPQPVFQSIVLDFFIILISIHFPPNTEMITTVGAGRPSIFVVCWTGLIETKLCR